MNNFQNCTVMVVDDSKTNIDVMVELLDKSCDIMVAMDGQTALEMMREEQPDLALLDIMMPGMDGLELCRLMKADPALQDIDVIFVTAMGESFDEQQGLAAGAVDYIIKPIKPGIVTLRVKNHLELKMAREQLKDHNNRLQEAVRERTEEIQNLQDITIESLASLAETRDPETGNHILRTKNYVRVLVEHLMQEGSSCCRGNHAYADLIIKSASLHDIGKVGIPDHILLKPGKLTTEEFEVIKQHTVFGYQALKKAEKRLGSNSFLSIAADLAHSHHERWDGTGYPQGLQGSEIPLCGRLMAIADIYDALISRRSYKNPLSHEKAVEIITQGDGRTLPEHFDPDVLSAFISTSNEFERISIRYAEE